MTSLEAATSPELNKTLLYACFPTAVAQANWPLADSPQTAPTYTEALFSENRTDFFKKSEPKVKRTVQSRLSAFTQPRRTARHKKWTHFVLGLRRRSVWAIRLGG